MTIKKYQLATDNDLISTQKNFVAEFFLSFCNVTFPYDRKIDEKEIEKGLQKMRKKLAKTEIMHPRVL